MGFKTVYIWKTIFWGLWSTPLLAQASPWIHKCWDGLPISKVSSLLLYQSILPSLVETATLLIASPTPPIAHLQEDRTRSRWGKNWSGVSILLRDPKFQSIFSQHGHGALFQPQNLPGWGLDTPYIFLFLTHASNLMYTYFQKVFFTRSFSPTLFIKPSFPSPKGNFSVRPWATPAPCSWMSKERGWQTPPSCCLAPQFYE